MEADNERQDVNRRIAFDKMDSVDRRDRLGVTKSCGFGDKYDDINWHRDENKEG